MVGLRVSASSTSPARTRRSCRVASHSVTATDTSCRCTVTTRGRTLLPSGRLSIRSRCSGSGAAGVGTRPRRTGSRVRGRPATRRSGSARRWSPRCPTTTGCWVWWSVGRPAVRLLPDAVAAARVRRRPGPIGSPEPARPGLPRRPRARVCRGARLLVRPHGMEIRPGSVPGFTSLLRPDGIPVRLLLQELVEGDRGTCGRTWTSRASTERPRRARHVALGPPSSACEGGLDGARRPRAGARYCLTDRGPR